MGIIQYISGENETVTTFWSRSFNISSFKQTGEDEDFFRAYSGGVYTQCALKYDTNTTVLNHLMVIEGYGTDDQYGDYWLVRNSWCVVLSMSTLPSMNINFLINSISDEQEK